MRGKIKVGLIYGGASFEHQVSKMTAKSIEQNIDRSLFEIIKIYIDKKGKFNCMLLKDIDIAFLAVHGPNCEDGKLQSYLEKKGIKYTGSRIETSKINMDKIRMHKAFNDEGINTVKYLGFKKNQTKAKIGEKIDEEIGFPCVIKPNNTGSSIGISKVEDFNGLRRAISLAFIYDKKIIIEEAIEEPRELEIAVLGNKRLILSEPGEILAHGRVYSYQSKYFRPFKTKTVAENLKKGQINQIKEMARKAYLVTGCRGYARIDFFRAKDGEIYINEINTLPGFTKISMFPKMMAAKGIKYKDLITRIINLVL
ncbi:MAG: D-alanine--D-alanine ligase [Candidatus Berkelbacteria bacterium]|nr:D-alanine--D-alanine ligase [Candidatus Berkelbacteria bacterium]